MDRAIKPESMDAAANTPFEGRRGALVALLGGAVLTGMAASAQAQTASSVDTAAMQFTLNLQYLTANLLQRVLYGPGRELPADFIRGGESTDRPGVPATTGQDVPTLSQAQSIRSRLNEIADDSYWRTRVLRSILRADAVPQTTISYTPETFTAMFRLAGAIAPDAVFNPYTSPTNLLLAVDTLCSVQASVYAGILPSLTNDIVLPLMSSMASSAANNATTVRAMLHERAATMPELLTMVDALAAWRDRIDGTTVTDRPLSPTLAGGQTVTRIATIDSDGLFIRRTPEQSLNVLFMSPAAVTRGGFFPAGINGVIVRSTANGTA